MDIHSEIANIYKSLSGRVLATLLRLLGDHDLAEEALQEAFAAALETWPREGLPHNPAAWLVSAGRFRIIDSMRRDSRRRELLRDHVDATDLHAARQPEWDDSIAVDDRLRLIFFCCHPLLPADARIALALRDVCGMRTDEIARAYLIGPETIKKRIARAKALFRQKNIPYEVPSAAEIGARLNTVLHVVYLIFNEGYAAAAGADRIRRDLTDEAIFLARTLTELTQAPESLGLLALLLLQEARRASRTDVNGEIVALEDQDRSLWDRNLIREGVDLIQRAIMFGRIGPYTLQAAIASVHAQADSVASTQWDLIVDYYDMLLQLNKSPVVELNRAIAVSMLNGPAAGLELLETLLNSGELHSYHLLFAAKADFLFKLGRFPEAAAACSKAIELVEQDAERRYLQRRLREIHKKLRGNVPAD